MCHSKLPIPGRADLFAPSVARASSHSYTDHPTSNTNTVYSSFGWRGGLQTQ